MSKACSCAACGKTLRPEDPVIQVAAGTVTARGRFNPTSREPLFYHERCHVRRYGTPQAVIETLRREAAAMPGVLAS